MLTKYLIICPLIFIAGFIDAVAGGGGLVSLPAYMITGIPVHNCIATNKMSPFMGTSVTTAKYAFLVHLPDHRLEQRLHFLFPTIFLRQSL